MSKRGAEKRWGSLNPLLMGDSLLTPRHDRRWQARLRVSIPFSWGTHFSQGEEHSGEDQRQSGLNPLLMGDSLLTIADLGKIFKK